MLPGSSRSSGGNAGKAYGLEAHLVVLLHVLGGGGREEGKEEEVGLGKQVVWRQGRGYGGYEKEWDGTGGGLAGLV